MTRPSASAGGLLALLLCGATLHAQQPPPCCPCVPDGVPAPCDAPAAVPAFPPAYPDCAPCARQLPFAVELLLGQELGLRAQVGVPLGGRQSFVVEGFYGGLSTNLGSSAALGAGVRSLWQECWADGVSSFVIGPGVDLFLQTNHRHLILLTPSVDFAWLLSLARDLAWEVGVEAGLGVGLGGHTSHGHEAAGDFAPVISVYTGLRF